MHNLTAPNGDEAAVEAGRGRPDCDHDLCWETGAMYTEQQQQQQGGGYIYRNEANSGEHLVSHAQPQAGTHVVLSPCLLDGEWYIGGDATVVSFASAVDSKVSMTIVSGCTECAFTGAAGVLGGDGSKLVRTCIVFLFIPHLLRPPQSFSTTSITVPARVTHSRH